MDWSGSLQHGSTHYGSGPSYNTSGIRYEEGMRLATRATFSSVKEYPCEITRAPGYWSGEKWIPPRGGPESPLDGATWMIAKGEV